MSNPQTHTLACLACSSPINLMSADGMYYTSGVGWYDHFLLWCERCGDASYFFTCMLDAVLVDELERFCDVYEYDVVPEIDRVEFRRQFGFICFADVPMRATQRRRFIHWAIALG